MAKAEKGKSDFWTAEAKRLGYPSRSVFKLIEIDKKFKLLSPSVKKVLDIGSAPGGWTLYSAKKLTSATVVSCDLNPLSISLPPNVLEITADAFLSETVAKFKSYGVYDIIISDAAPHTTGIRDVDCQRSLDIVTNVVSLSGDLLKTGGSLVFKIFQGEGLKPLINDLKPRFNTVSIFKPEASRATSFECFVVCLKKR